MLKTLEGVYKDGKVELAEQPDGVKEGQVLVIFLEPASNGDNGTPRKGQMIRCGMFAGLIETTEEDFKAAEFHGDPDDGLDWS